MTCPLCAGKTTVTTTRSNIDHVIRYRQCLRCQFIFRTIEMEEDLYENIEKGKNTNAND